MSAEENLLNAIFGNGPEGYVWESPEEGDGETWTLYWPGQREDQYASVVIEASHEKMFSAEVGLTGMYRGAVYQSVHSTLEEAKAAIEEYIPKFKKEFNPSWIRR